MIGLKNKIRKIGAGFMAGLCAFSILGTSMGNLVQTKAANTITTENSAFPSADKVIAQAATLLGSPYGWGFKGYTGVYYQGSYSPLSLDFTRNQGVDCSGLIYYTLTHLGYKTSGFSWNNPVPVDTAHWLTISDSCTISYNGITSKIDVEKADIPYTERPYWECADGSTIAPGSVVIADNLSGEDHSWIYMGEFENRSEVVDYLRNIGVNESYINSKTVGDGSGDGGTHWRIESNGSDGCVINNRTDGKKATAMNMYAFRITKSDVKFSITKVLSADNSVKISGTSPIDNSKAVYGVYTDKACKNKVGEITIGADGTGSITLPDKQYYVKEISAPTGYDLSTDVVANENMHRVFAYLIKQRFIDPEIVTHFAKNHTLYEDKEHHNAVFVGVDENGIPRQAHKRSTSTFGKSFRQTVEGSDTKYSFAHFGDSEKLLIFEAPIDMLSYLTLHLENWQKHSYIAMNGVYENAVLTALKGHSDLFEIVICTDNDIGGIDAADRLRDILKNSEYTDIRRILPTNKDWNEGATRS